MSGKRRRGGKGEVARALLLYKGGRKWGGNLNVGKGEKRGVVFSLLNQFDPEKKGRRSPQTFEELDGKMGESFR